MRLSRIVTAPDEISLAAIDDNEARLLDLTQVESVTTLSDILHAPDPTGLAEFLVDRNADPVSLDTVTLLAPVDQQEVWAAGVTYKRSQVARMEESEAGASHYDKVYTADRPELFFKATPNRIAAHGEPVRVRADSNWSVPEPEFTLAINPEGGIAGYTIGNDMSARDIEGENPLYLPQAKLYNQCAALGPSVLLAKQPLDRAATSIVLRIERGAGEVFRGETNLDQMARQFEDLVTWLFRENEFPHGVFLMTGTGIVPDDSFTLENGDLVHIDVSGLGTLTNPVVKAS